MNISRATKIKLFLMVFRHREKRTFIQYYLMVIRDREEDIHSIKVIRLVLNADAHSSQNHLRIST
jgi:hypothetical protein